MTVADGLDAHDRRVIHARPCREGDQAAMRRRIVGREDQEDAQHGIDAGDHLQVIAAHAAVPDPTRWP
jgi:hypothetical protein